MKEEDIKDIKNDISFAMEMLEFTKAQSSSIVKRLYTIIIVLIITLICSIAFNIYLLSSMEETSTIIRSIDIDDIDKIQDSEISNY